MPRHETHSGSRHRSTPMAHRPLGARPEPPRHPPPPRGLAGSSVLGASQDRHDARIAPGTAVSMFRCGHTTSSPSSRAPSLPSPPARHSPRTAARTSPAPPRPHPPPHPLPLLLPLLPLLPLPLPLLPLLPLPLPLLPLLPLPLPLLPLLPLPLPLPRPRPRPPARRSRAARSPEERLPRPGPALTCRN